MAGCERCDHGWLEIDGAYARCPCVVAPDPGEVRDAVDAMAAEPARLHRGASVAQQMTVDSLDAVALTERRAWTLRLVASHTDGITCDALEATHGGSHQSVSATLNWLERHGLVERDHDDLRRTRSGRTANPYHCTAKGAASLREIRTPTVDEPARRT